jgi:uncharacterized Zn finger protein
VVLVIYCTRCRRQGPAERATVLVKEGGRQVRRWSNRCQSCGTDHVAPDPSRAPARAAARGSERSQRQAEAAGQLRLFPKVRRQ